MMKLNIIQVYFFFLCSVILYGQETEKDTLSVSSKIDTIYTLQKKMYTESKNQPLSDKKYGLEFNVFRLLMVDESVSLSGGFSLFSANRHAELAFPVFFSNPKDPKDLRELTIDCHLGIFWVTHKTDFI